MRAIHPSIKQCPFGKAIHARKQILIYIEQAMLQRQKTPTQDVLSLLMQAKDETGQGLSQEEIKSQALALLIGTNSNTASMLVCFCMALAQHPEVLHLARTEQHQIEQTSIDASLSLEQLKQMIYLNQVLQEVERCYPPVGAGFRRVIKPFVFNGYAVPSGWNAMYSIIGPIRILEFMLSQHGLIQIDLVQIGQNIKRWTSAWSDLGEELVTV